MDAQMPLSGIRVLDLTIWGNGPFTGLMLGDMGAEVIKIEQPLTGEYSRGAQSLWGKSLLLPDGRSILWELFNRNKKGITVDLTKNAGRQVLYDLVPKSDVFVTNYSLNALNRFGATSEILKAHNPRIIYARSGGFGARGPDANAPCQDTAGMARSGLMFNAPAPDGGPTYLTGALSDIFCGTALAMGILTSLISKERLGIPQDVYTSQLLATMWFQYLSLNVLLNLGYDFDPFDRNKQANPLMNLYKCGDGKWIALGIMVSDKKWPKFCQAMALQHLEKDPLYSTEVKRSENRQKLISLLDSIFASKPRSDWERVLKDNDLAFSIVNRLSDLPNDKQVQANNYVVEFEDGMKWVSSPFELEKAPLPKRGRAPFLGEHTEEVLKDICGYDWERINALRDQGFF